MTNHHLSSVDDCRQQLLELRKLLDFSVDVICSFDQEGRFINVSAAAKTVWGYSPEELVGKRYMDMLVPDDHQRTIAIASAIMSGSEVTNFQNRYRRKDGSVVPILWSARWEAKEKIIYCVARDATAKVEAGQKAVLDEQRLFRTYKLVNLGWWEWNFATNENTVSDELYGIYGLRKTEYPNISTDVYLSLVHPDDLPTVKRAIDSALQLALFEYEHRMIKPSGEIIFVHHYVQVIRDAEGYLVQMHGTTKDITKNKQAESALRTSEARLSAILESIDDGFFAVDKEWTVTYWNRRAEEALQQKRENILGRNLWAEYQDAVSLKFYSEYHRAIRENTPVQFEEYLSRVRKWFEVTAYPSAEGLSVYFKDISDRKRQQEALKESNQRYEYVTKATHEAIWDWNLLTDVIYWGEGFQTIFGHRLNDLQSDIHAWKNHIHPADVERVLRSLCEAIESTGQYWTDEYRYLKADGSYAHVVDKGFVIRDAKGNAVRMVGAMQDITRQKEAEQAVRLSEERFRLLFYQSPKPKWMFRGDNWQIVEVNEVALKLYGFSKQEFLQLTIPDLKVPSELDQLRRFKEKKVLQHNVVQHVKRNGEVFSIEISTHAIDLPSGEHFIVEGDDVTEKLRLQQELIEEKIAAQKEVAKVILDTQERERSEIGKELHDNVNQLLTTAKLYVENIHYFPGQQDAYVQKSVSLLQKSINEIRFLCKQLVTPVVNDIDFEATVDELVSHYESLSLFEIERRYAVCEKLLDKGLKLTIYRIIQEQLNNIVKYAQASSVKVAVYHKDNVLNVVVRDNGVGFDKSKATKGLGLNNMKNRAEVYKGRVNIQSAPGEGSVITVSFPLAVSGVV